MSHFILFLLLDASGAASNPCDLISLRNVRAQSSGKNADLNLIVTQCIDTYKYPFEASELNMGNCMQTSKLRMTKDYQDRDALACLNNQRGGGGFAQCLEKLPGLSGTKTRIGKVSNFTTPNYMTKITYREAGRLICLRNFKTQIAEKDCRPQVAEFKNAEAKKEATGICDFIKNREERLVKDQVKPTAVPYEE